MPDPLMISHLEEARPELEKIDAGELADAWRESIDEFLQAPPGGDADRLRDALAENCRLSRPGLDAGLDVVLRGVRSDEALGVFEQARELRSGGRRASEGPALVILASNLPGLAVQSLLPALALRRPLLVKSASAEPLFAPAFLRALAERVPVIGRAYAAAAWPGGSREIEDPLIAGAGRVVAYGDATTIDDLRRRAGSKLIAFGPKFSLGLVGRSVLAEDLDAVAAGLARDVALFDQRGCLSVQAVITDGDAGALAEALARALGELAERWPMSRDGGAAVAARQARDEAIMRGGRLAPLSMSAGTVVVEPPGGLLTSPGRRFVRIHEVPAIEQAIALLRPWRGSIQGVAASGAEAVEDALIALGVSRLAAPGSLQDADVATWRNGGLAPLEAYL